MHCSVAWICGLFVLLAALTRPALACWVPVNTPDALTFHTEAQGEKISGEFTGYNGILCIGAGEKQEARMRLNVRIDSVETGLPELDDAIRGPSFLDSNRWPEATFESESITRLEGHRYRVRGRFSLRDVTRELEVTFRFTPVPGDDKARLTGTMSINRLDYGVGQGRWGDTRWAADIVTLKFSVKLADAEGSPVDQ